MSERRFWYLACPYTHPDEAVRGIRFRAASDAAAKLMENGRLVFSPITHGHAIGEHAPWEAWMALDLAILDSPRCEGVIVLTIVGWDKSAGVQAEIAAAKALGKPVLYLDPLEWRVREEAAA